VPSTCRFFLQSAVLSLIHVNRTLPSPTVTRVSLRPPTPGSTGFSVRRRRCTGEFSPDLKPYFPSALPDQGYPARGAPNSRFRRKFACMIAIFQRVEL